MHTIIGRTKKENMPTKIGRREYHLFNLIKIRLETYSREISSVSFDYTFYSQAGMQSVKVWLVC